MMRETRLTLPQVALIAATRGMAGAGIGLLLADRLPAASRKAVGWTLLAVGVLTAIPLAAEIFGASRSLGSFGSSASSREESLAYSS
jgi:hypothetical protein